jgi:glycosyltransferase involved in cell wall biosynthesis
MSQLDTNTPPLVSVVIPTQNCAKLISVTLASIFKQSYPLYEVIIVDCSIDKTVEMINSFHQEKVKIYSMGQCKRYEMLNKGLSQANGMYINFLFPGDFYLSMDTLQQVMSLATQRNFPDLIYCGTLLRDGQAEVKTLFRELSLDLLKRGEQPTSLQACWFRTEMIRDAGKFNPYYRLRGGFDLMCRCLLRKSFHTAALDRFLLDHDFRVITRRMVMVHFFETLKTIYFYFGISITVRWLFSQREGKRFLKIWWRNLKIAFFGR